MPTATQDILTTQERTADNTANRVIYQRSFFAYELAAQYAPGKAVLEIACGVSGGAAFLAESAQEVVALDYDPEVVAYNQKLNADQTNLFFEQGEAPPISLPDNRFDLVVAFQFIEHIEQRPQLLREVYRVLKPGGMLLLTTPNRKMTLVRNPYHVYEYTFGEMARELKPLFDTYELKGLFGNQKVMTYHQANTRWVRRFMALDVLGLHRYLPAQVLKAPYDLFAGMMRNQLAKKNQAELDVSTQDFFLASDNLEGAFDIYAFAHKAV